MKTEFVEAIKLIAEAVSNVSGEDDFYDRMASALSQATGADGCDFFLRAPGDGLVMRASTYTPEYALRCKLGRGVGLCGQALISEKSQAILSGARNHPDNVAYPGVDEREDEAVIVAPLLGENGVALGVCLLLHREPWPLDEAATDRILKTIEFAAIQIRCFQNAMRIGGLSSRMEAVSEVSRSIASSPYIEEILQLLVNMTAQQFGYTVCTVRLLDEARGELVLRATQAPARAYQRKAAIKLGQSIAGKAIAEKRPIVVHDVLDDPDYIGHDLAAEQGLRSMVCLPLSVQDRPVGVISCYTSEIHEFDETEIAALETIAKQAAFAVEHAKLQVRSTLMQEMHHRVKNNLQQVASLLRLQIRHGSYSSLEDALEESLGRILAISAVHDLLSREDLDHVGMKTLAETLIQIQRDSLIAPDRDIRFEIRGDDVHLNTQQGTQVALILNELLQNAIIHGYSQAVEGDVHVTIEDKGVEIGLWVSNRGDALPPDFDPAAQGHLGLKIVESLARSMGGKLVLEDRLGWTIAEVKFVPATAE